MGVMVVGELGERGCPARVGSLAVDGRGDEVGLNLAEVRRGWQHPSPSGFEPFPAHSLTALRAVSSVKSTGKKVLRA